MCSILWLIQIKATMKRRVGILESLALEPISVESRLPYRIHSEYLLILFLNNDLSSKPGWLSSRVGIWCHHLSVPQIVAIRGPATH